MLNEKVHFKLYKSGKKWLVAAIGVVTLSVGLSQAPLHTQRPRTVVRRLLIQRKPQLREPQVLATRSH
ncbi:KxYKxGKxW signal peptide domain-containing protein [Lactiplantibacillus carotarum]|uniref:KxYKxGKxW signal peptide domain-containing protein n=1 Tax=Lactiplantibacillus carotarum TaxID=2993456 RepID=UPI0038517829